MKSFDDSWKENRHVFESTKNLAKAMYLDGQQSKQDEVDELQKSLNIYQEKVMKIQIAISNRLGDDDQLDYVLNYFDKILEGDQS